MESRPLSAFDEEFPLGVDISRLGGLGLAKGRPASTFAGDSGKASDRTRLWVFACLPASFVLELSWASSEDASSVWVPSLLSVA